MQPVKCLPGCPGSLPRSFLIHGNDKDNIRNAHIRGKLKTNRFGQKVRQSRLRWYGHVKRRHDDYVCRNGLEMRLQAKRRRGKTNEEVFERGEGGHAGGRSEGWSTVCSMFMENPIRRPLNGKPKEEEEYFE